MATIKKGFIIDQLENTLLPITRAELVLDSDGIIALNSKQFLAKNGLPGLVTATERALINQLSGSGEGQNLSDLYTKLDYINNGLKIDGTIVRFYNETTGTPINITSTLDDSENPTLALSVDNTNKISIGLNTLSQSGISASDIIRSVSVDKYGRVVAVSGSELTNDDIPQTLSGKILSGATTYTTDIADNEKAVVNKAYVDAKFDSVSTIATGSLIFGGTLSTDTSAAGVLGKENYYYKVTGAFTIKKENIYTGDNSVTAGMDIMVKIGDTLIIKGGKFVYVPSADEKETFITVGKDNETPILNKAQGEVIFNFDGPFIVTQGSGNTANISITQASDKTNGYLSADDYNKFNSYASQAPTTYKGEFSADDEGSYKIGTLTVADRPYGIYGINNTYSLSLITGIYNQENCPALKFTENNNDSFYNIYGYNGINATIDGTTLKLSATNIVDVNSSNYLEILENYKFKVKIGRYDDSNNVIIPGLVDYTEFHEYKQEVFNCTVTFASIENKLTDTNKTYHYGSDALAIAIAVEI